MAILVRTSSGWKNVGDIDTRTSSGIKGINRVFTKVNSTTWKEVPIVVDFRITSVRTFIAFHSYSRTLRYTYTISATDLAFTRVNLQIEKHSWKQQHTGGVDDESRETLVEKNYPLIKGNNLINDTIDIEFTASNDRDDSRFSYNAETRINVLVSFFDGNTRIYPYPTNPAGRVRLPYTGQLRF